MPGETTYSKYIWDYFMVVLGNEFGVAALMGNLYAESGLRPNNLQNSYEDSLGYTDTSYTAAVDSGEITKSQFISTSHGGYGLAQWTYPSRKQSLYEYWKDGGYDSIGSIELACDFLCNELFNSFDDVVDVLLNATSIREASDKVLHDFESPEDQSETVEIKRYGYAVDYYNLYAGTSPEEPDNNEAIIEQAIAWAVAIAYDDSHGYDQENRWSPDYDCSSLLIQAYQNAGCPVKTNGATYTGDMEQAFVISGFQSIPYYNGMELLRGDVLLRSGHTAMYIGNGNIVSAHINENGEVTGGQSGDQTGHEIDVSAFSSSGNWVTVLRLPVGGYTPTPVKSKGMSLLLLLLATRR